MNNIKIINKIKIYIFYLKKNNFSINTVKTYKSVLNMYCFKLNDIRLIKKSLKERFNSPNTAWLHYNVLNSFLKWSKDKRIGVLNNLKLPQIPKKYMVVFKKQYLVVKTKINDFDSKILKQKKIIIKFLFETGIRANELKNILEFNISSIKVLGKGNKIRDVFCKRDTLREIKHINFNFSTKTLRIWVKEILGKKFTPHSIRRSLATHLLLKGADPKMVMLQLGHEKIETTFRYLQLSYSINKKIYDKYF